MNDLDRRREWTNLGLSPSEQDRLERSRVVPVLTADRVDFLSERLAFHGQSRRTGFGPGLQLAWMAIRLNPGSTLGASLGLMMAGIVLTHVNPGPSPALWAVVAPWMALSAAFFGQQPQKGALGLIVRQAPQGWGSVRLWGWILLTVMDMVLATCALMAGNDASLTPALIDWLAPFILALALALALERALPKAWGQGFTVGLVGFNTVLGLLAWSSGRVMLTPVLALLRAGHGIPVPMAIAVVLLVAALQIRRPSYV